MNYLDKRKLIKSGYNLPILGFGAAPFMLSNNNVNNNSSAKTINSALNMGINYFDTAPWYGLGRSELRIGNILREMGRKKEELENYKKQLRIKPTTQLPVI